MKKNFQRMHPYIKDGRFYNYPNETPEGFFWRSLYIYLKSFTHRLFYKPGLIQWQTTAVVTERSNELLITWIGHSTFLIQIAGVNILTDPIFGDATSLFPRILKPGIELSQLPPIDYVLISHNHLDHMDAKALTMIRERNPQCRYLVPLGDKQWFDKRGFMHVNEYTWWQEDRFVIANDNALMITFLPAFHWSQRGLFDKNRSLWGSWMIEIAGKRIYFAGDTAYSHHFKLIGQMFAHIDYAIMPIGPCEPHKWMKFSHINAQEAYQGFCDLGAEHFIPMHWGTFYFGTDEFDTSLKSLQTLWQQKMAQQLKNERLHVMHIGQTLEAPVTTVTEVVADQIFFEEI